MIIQTVTESGFRDAFRNIGRADQFSHEALGLLFDYLEQYSEDSGEPVELDVIALCCEYSEMDAEEVAEAYSDAPQPAEIDSDEHDEAVSEWLNEQTTVCGKTGAGSFVFAQF